MELSLQNPAVVIVVTVVIVLLINLGIYASLAKRKHNNSVGQIELWRRAMEQARNPWGKEDDALKELSERAERLRASQRKKPQENAGSLGEDESRPTR